MTEPLFDRDTYEGMVKLPHTMAVALARDLFRTLCEKSDGTAQFTELLEMFAALVAAAEREAVIEETSRMGFMSRPKTRDFADVMRRGKRLDPLTAFRRGTYKPSVGGAA